jgi:hypothetical protein
LNAPPTETFSDCPEFETSDPWDSRTKEEYIEDIPENSCEDTDFCDYKHRQFDIFCKQADDYVVHYYRAGGKTKHCIVLEQ